MTTPSSSQNPLRNETGLPRFDLISAEHVVPAVGDMLKEKVQQLTELEQTLKPTWDGLLKPLADMERAFEYTWGPVQHLFGVKNSPELREAYEAVLNDVVAFGLKSLQSQPIYRGLKSLQGSDEWQQLNQAQKRIIERRIQEAELAGIGLPDDQRQRFNEIEQELSKLSTEFSNHVLDATKAFSYVLTDKADVDGFPDSLLQLTAQAYNAAKKEDEPAATPEMGPWRITLDTPCFGPVMQHSRNRPLREKLYHSFISRASMGELDNTPLINRILELRKEKAKLLGFGSYAELSLSRKMADDVDTVETMLETLRAASWEPAEQDLAELKKCAEASGQSDPLAHWDLAFWAERLREQKYQFTDEELRPYFSLERTLDGMFDLVKRIFGINVEQVEDFAPLWHPDVRYFRVTEESGEEIAAFYLDPYSRPEDKRGGAWMDDCLSRRWYNGQLQIPIAHLVCNSTPPVGEKPSLMTFREVETLFHEFGHGLQHMLTTVDEADAAGISGVEWDAVELPSQFMENWCYHKPTLLGMAVHYETGETLPDELFEKICAARNYRAGSDMLRQLQFGLTDLELHHRYDPAGDEDVFELMRRISEKTSVMPMLPENRSLCSFQHIFAGGYAAGYYSYKWAEVLSADAFGAFEEAGLDDDAAVAATGRRFRDTVLALGGGQHPMEIFKAFRGREPDPNALLKQSGLI